MYKIILNNYYENSIVLLMYALHYLDTYKVEYIEMNKYKLEYNEVI